MDQVVVGDELDVSSLGFYLKAPIDSTYTSDNSMFSEKLVTKIAREFDKFRNKDMFFIVLDMSHNHEVLSFELAEFNHVDIFNLIMRFSELNDIAPVENNKIKEFLNANMKQYKIDVSVLNFEISQNNTLSKRKVLSILRKPNVINSPQYFLQLYNPLYALQSTIVDIDKFHHEDLEKLLSLKN